MLKLVVVALLQRPMVLLIVAALGSASNNGRLWGHWGGHWDSPNSGFVGHHDQNLESTG
jgi:hypothetical protein